LKKVKPESGNSSATNSNQQSPAGKGSKDAIYDSSDNQSNMEEEIGSPSAVSNCDNADKINTLSLLIPQRSLSTPIFPNMSSLALARANSQCNYKQTLNALETLQKRFVEYQITSLRDTLIKAQLIQSSLVIPSLKTTQEQQEVNPIKRIVSKEKSSADNDENEPEIFYGEVEYPLLHLAPKSMQVEEINKKVKNAQVKVLKGKRVAKLSDDTSLEGDKQNDSLLESLTATRAGTQRSELEMAINLRELSEQFAEVIGKNLKKSNKSKKNEESVKSKDSAQKYTKLQKKEKVKESKINKAQEKDKKPRARKEAREELLSPVSKGRKMMERKKNRWQLQEQAEVEAQKFF